MRPKNEAESMDTANGTLRLGMRARITGGENAGHVGTITHLYGSGVMAGLGVLDDHYVAEGVNIHPLPAEAETAPMFEEID